jgi:hypothetical protein
MINMTTIIVQVTCLGVAVVKGVWRPREKTQERSHIAAMGRWGREPSNREGAEAALAALGGETGPFCVRRHKDKDKREFCTHTKTHTVTLVRTLAGTSPRIHACMSCPWTVTIAPSFPPTATAQHVRSPSHCVACVSCMSGMHACMSVLDHCDQLYLDDLCCVLCWLCQSWCVLS